MFQYYNTYTEDSSVRYAVRMKILDPATQSVVEEGFCGSNKHTTRPCPLDGAQLYQKRHDAEQRARWHRGLKCYRVGQIETSVVAIEILHREYKP